MKKTIIGGVIIAILIIVGFISSPKFKMTPYRAEAGEIKIGVAVPLTGLAAIVGENERNGVKLAVDEINKNGGIAGKQVVPIFEDDQTDAKVSVTAIKKLIDIDKADVLIGGTWDFLANAVIPVIDQEKKVFFTPSALPDTLERTSPYLFVVHSPVSIIEGTVANFLKQFHGQDVVTISVNVPWGRAHLKAFKAAISESGNKLAKEIVMPNFDNNDIQRELSLVKSLKPAAILVAINFSDSANFVKKKHDLGVSGKILAQYNLGDAYNKGNIPADLLSEVTVFLYSEPNDDFAQRYKKIYNTNPGTYADTAYDAVYIIKQAIENAGGKTDSDSIIQGIRKVTNYKGASGLVDFGKVNYPTNKKVILKEFKNGNFVPVQ